MQYDFDWDPEKARRNFSKHGVTFEQATGVFKDPMALTIYDDGESLAGEDRWITLGQVNGQHYLLVIHTYRQQNKNSVIVRLISARPATKLEIRQYEG